MELKKLMAATTTQTAFLDELLALLERETAELSAVNIPAMTQTNLAKEELLRKIAEHTPVMQQAIAAMAVREGFPSDTPLGVIAERLARKGVTEVLRERKRLEKTAEKVRRIAAVNHGIADRFVTTISTSLKLVTRIINQSNVYGATGEYQKGHAGAVMINREA
jgi:flagellar biosynthesis/type III secretory pathway chaperone